MAEYVSDPTPEVRQCRDALGSVAPVRFVSNPPGGTVSVDGKEYGPAPTEVRLSVPWWEHEVTVAFGSTKVRVSSTDLVKAFDDKACEMTDVVVDGPDEWTASQGKAPPSPREAAESAAGTAAGATRAFGSQSTDTTDSGGGIHTRWWFWTSVGVVAAAAVVTGVLIATSSDKVHRREPETGDKDNVVTALELP